MRKIVVAVFLVLAGSPVGVGAQVASQGEQVYKRHCARCHEGAMPRMPSRVGCENGYLVNPATGP